MVVERDLVSIPPHHKRYFHGKLPGDHRHSKCGTIDTNSLHKVPRVFSFFMIFPLKEPIRDWRVGAEYAENGVDLLKTNGR